jgi:hypothetical protein
MDVVQTPHKLWPAQELRTIRDGLQAFLVDEASTTAGGGGGGRGSDGGHNGVDVQDTYDVSLLLRQIAAFEGIFQRRKKGVRKGLEDLEQQIATQERLVAALEAQAQWDHHRRQTAERQAKTAWAHVVPTHQTAAETTVFDGDGGRSFGHGLADDFTGGGGSHVPMTVSARPGAQNLNAELQHIIDQSVLQEQVKNEGVNSLTQPLAQLDVALHEYVR